VLALGAALQACAGYASELDTLGVGGGSTLESGTGSTTSRRSRAPCAGPSCVAGGESGAPAAGANGSSSSSLPLSDAGPALAPTPAEPDGGAAPGPDAAPPFVDDCQGPGEFTEAEGAGCFLWVAELETWDGARDACSAWGGRLAHIDAQSEDDRLAQYMSADSWIGAVARGDAAAHTWEDGSALTFTNWANDQPDDFEGDEDCVEKLQRNAQWNDQLCDEKNAFFCERSGPPSE
jgi:hypothetical protein